MDVMLDIHQSDNRVRYMAVILLHEFLSLSGASDVALYGQTTT